MVDWYMGVLPGTAVQLGQRRPTDLFGSCGDGRDVAAVLIVHPVHKQEGEGDVVQTLKSPQVQCQVGE